MRTDWEIGFYNSDFERVLKWYTLAFQGKHPTKEDQKVFEKFSIVLSDLEQQDLEEKKDAEDD